MFLLSYLELYNTMSLLWYSVRYLDPQHREAKHVHGESLNVCDAKLHTQCAPSFWYEVSMREQCNERRSSPRFNMWVLEIRRWRYICYRGSRSIQPSLIPKRCERIGGYVQLQHAALHF